MPPFMNGPKPVRTHSHSCFQGGRDKGHNSEAAFQTTLRLPLVFGLVVLLASSLGLCAQQDPEVSKAPVWACYKAPKEHVVWRAKLGGMAGGVALLQDRVLVGTSFNKEDPLTHRTLQDGGAMMGFHSQTGELLWQSAHPRLPERVNDMMGIVNSRPWVEGKRAWYVSNRGELVCVDTEGFRDGKNDGPFTAEELTGPNDADYIWKLDMVRELGVFKRDAGDNWSVICSPVVLGDLVYCVTGEGCRLSGEPSVAPSFLAVNKESGKVVWSSRAPGQAIIHLQWSSPVIARVNSKDQVVFPGGDGWLYGFESKTGKEIWKVNCNDPVLRDWRATENGRNDWRHGEMKHFFVGAPTVHKDTLYVGLNQDFESSQTNAPLYAISLGHQGDATAKAVRWKFQHPDFGSTYCSAAVADGIVYVLGHRAVLFALDEKNGEVIWHCRLASDVHGFGSPVLADGKIWVGTDEGDLFVFRAGGEKKCLGHFELPGVIYHPPVVTKNTAYIAVGEFLWKLRLPE